MYSGAKTLFRRYSGLCDRRHTWKTNVTSTTNVLTENLGRQRFGVVGWVALPGGIGTSVEAYHRFIMAMNSRVIIGVVSQ